MASEGVWTWDNSKKTGTYRNWAHNEPNDYKSGEDCGTIRGKDRTVAKYPGSWNDIRCSRDEFVSLCEQGKMPAKLMQRNT